jgi:hypothetical protein
MAFPIAAIPIIGGLLDKILDKVAKDKVDDATMERLKQEAQRMLSDEGQEDLQAFYNFIIDYEGKASEHGKFIQWLRGSVRPVLTYVFSGFFIYIVFTWMTGEKLPEGSLTAVKLVFGINILTLGFWFGERAIERSGITELLKSKNP